MKKFIFLLMLIMVTACSKDIDNNLIGTWDLISVNGRSLSSGFFLRWKFAETILTVTSDMDCKEVIEYEIKNDVLRGISTLSQEGSECGPPESNIGEIGTYSVNRKTLTVEVYDPDMDPPNAIFVFERIN